MKDVSLHAVYLERDGATIELLHFASPGNTGESSSWRPLNQTGLTHLSFQVEDLDLVIGEVVRCGGRVHDDTRIHPSADVAAIFCTDPDGTLIELVRRSDG